MPARRLSNRDSVVPHTSIMYAPTVPINDLLESIYGDAEVGVRTDEVEPQVAVKYALYRFRRLCQQQGAIIDWPSLGPTLSRVIQRDDPQTQVLLKQLSNKFLARLLGLPDIADSSDPDQTRAHRLVLMEYIVACLVTDYDPNHPRTPGS